MTQKSIKSNDGGEQLFWGIFLLVIGGILTLISYLVWGTTFGYYYVYIGCLGFGLFWVISGIYNLLHPKKEFENALYRISRKIFYSLMFLIIVIGVQHQEITIVEFDMLF